MLAMRRVLAAATTLPTPCATRSDAKISERNNATPGVGRQQHWEPRRDGGYAGYAAPQDRDAETSGGMKMCHQSGEGRDRQLVRNGVSADAVGEEGAEGKSGKGQRACDKSRAQTMREALRHALFEVDGPVRRDDVLLVWHFHRRMIGNNVRPAQRRWRRQ